MSLCITLPVHAIRMGVIKDAADRCIAVAGDPDQPEDQALIDHLVRAINHHDALVGALCRISLAEADSTTSAADKVRDMARIARTTLAALEDRT